MTTRRTILAAAAATLASPAVARAQTVRWRMVTSWPRRLPGPGLSAERIAERIRTLSGGRLEIQVFAAGEIVPAFEVLGAVASQVADIGHSASFFWQARTPAVNWFTTVPFGLLPVEHMSWIEVGGGQALWDELYRPFGVKPFMGGNTGVAMGGWFRRELRGLDDLRGLRIRSLGLGGEMFRRLGAAAVSMPPGEIFPALQAGTIDAAEFVGPGTDAALGLWRIAPFYYGPGFAKPNGSSEAIVNLARWDALDSELKAIVSHACAAEAAHGLAEMERLNAEALAQFAGQGVRVASFPGEVIGAARRVAAEIVAEIAARDALSRRIHDSYAAFLARADAWARASTAAVIAARHG